jgi:hypothetical protein
MWANPVHFTLWDPLNCAPNPPTQGPIYPALYALGGVWYAPGMLTQGGQGGRLAPLASRVHKIPTRFLLSLHGI